MPSPPREVSEWLHAPLAVLRQVLGDDAPAGPRLAQIQQDERTLRKNRHCYVLDGDLGPYARWLLAIRILYDTLREQGLVTQESDVLLGLAEAMHADGAPEGEWETGGGPRRTMKGRGRPTTAVKDTADQLKALFARDHENTTPECFQTRDVLRRLLELVNATLPGRLRPLDLETFVSLPIHRGAAVAVPPASCLNDFETYIRHGVLPPRRMLEGLHVEHLVVREEHDPRRVQLGRLLASLATDDATDVHRPVIQVHGGDGASGLRAFATAALVALTEAGSPYTLVYVQLSRAEGSRGGPPSVRAIVRALGEAFSIARTHPDTPLPGLPVNLDVDLAPLRLALGRSRTLVVLDGVANAHGELSTLLDALRDTQFGEVIRALLQPPMSREPVPLQPYRSRFLVLANELVDELLPWTREHFRLSAPADPDTVRQLVLGTDPSLDAARAAAARTLGLEASTGERNQPGLRRTYGALTEKDFARPRPPGKLATAPDDFELLELTLVRHLPDATPTARPTLADWLEALRGRSYWLALIVKFVAASPNGIRRSTVTRLLHRWDEMLARSAATDAQVAASRSHHGELERLLSRHDSSLADFVAEFPALLASERDDDLEGITAVERRAEWAESFDPAETGVGGRAELLYVLRLESARRAIAKATVIGRDRADGAPHGIAEWMCIHYYLAEESLAQSSSQMRSLHARDGVHVSTHRRTMQALYHGVLSLGRDPREADQVFDRWTLPVVGAFPIAPQRRYRYLFSVVFKRLLDGPPSFMLARGHARPGLKLMLLKMMADPAWAMRATLGPVDGEDWAFEPLRADGRDSWGQEHPGLRLELLESLAHAAIDGDQRVLAQRALALARTQMRASASAASDAHAVPQAHAHEAFMKLEIDLHLLEGTDEALGEAQRKATTLLAECGAGRGDWYASLVRRVDETARRMRGGPVKHALDAMLGADAEHWLGLQPDGARRRTAIDMLNRLAQLEAVRAGEREQDFRGRYHALLRAYALSWTADRLRIGGQGSGLGQLWATIGARAARHSVRTCLALAGECSRDGVPEDALGFLRQARAVANVYARHLFALPRERVAMLLLEACIARARPAPGEDRVDHALDDAWYYVARAGEVAAELGCPDVVMRRMLFERALTAYEKAAARLGQRHWLAVARRDLATLERLGSGSRHWANNLQRLAERVHALGG